MIQNLHFTVIGFLISEECTVLDCLVGFVWFLFGLFFCPCDILLDFIMEGG